MASQKHHLISDFVLSNNTENHFVITTYLLFQREIVCFFYVANKLIAYNPHGFFSLLNLTLSPNSGHIIMIAPVLCT